jgi:spermidine/putrescine transport system ATP-binding protein
MSDTIVVMNQGVIQQVGAPIDIYNEPKNSFVADFIGESNIFPGNMNSDYSISFADYDFKCVDKGFAQNENVDVVVRPEDVKVTDITSGYISGIVESITFKGVHYEIIVVQGPRRWIIHSTQPANVGSEVGLILYPDDIHIMKKEG